MEMQVPLRSLTDRFCQVAKALNAEVQTDYFDEGTPGLALRVSRRGHKAWTFHYTRGGKRVRLTLGTYPATSLSAARTRVDEAKAALEAGSDPRIGKATLRSIFDEYQKREGGALRSAEVRRSAFERQIFPTLGERPVAEIKRSEIVRLLDQIEDNNGPVAARLAFAYLSKLFNWHAARDDDFVSPVVRGMARQNSRARDRILSDDELRKAWSAAATGVFGAYIRFLLLTAVRRTEAAQATWAEVADDVWTIPAARMKSKAEHVVPLSAAALHTINALTCPVPTIAKAFIFTTNGVAPIGGFTVRKAAFDKACGVTGWTLHDLRRTARSLMSRAGVSPDVAERCLAHVIPGVRGVYDRHEYLDEKRRAFEALAAQIDRIVNNPQPNVVALRSQPHA